MAVKALYDYDFPSKDRQELFGDDILVNVLWTNNMMFASAACFRAPKAMSWADFKSQMIDTVGRLGPRLRPVDARGLAGERRGLQPRRRHHAG